MLQDKAPCSATQGGVIHLQGSLEGNNQDGCAHSQAGQMEPSLSKQKSKKWMAFVKEKKWKCFLVKQAVI